MKQALFPIRSIKKLTPEIYCMAFDAPSISAAAQPGQFVNIHVDPLYPLLRRPFSIFDATGTAVSILFNVIGLGTKILAAKKIGDLLDVVGPCGNSFLPLLDAEYDTAVIVAGGMGIAPFPFLTKHLPPSKKVLTYIGARNTNHIVREGLRNVHIATDDGSEGYHGTVVDVMKRDHQKKGFTRCRFFTCGPSPMMRALAEFSSSIGAECYASLECDMACGIGLCQGCPVETIGESKKYRLVCTDGPVFETTKVKI